MHDLSALIIIKIVRITPSLQILKTSHSQISYSYVVDFIMYIFNYI